MKFRTYVEPRAPMRGLEVLPEVVQALARGERPRVTITMNGHSWKSRVALTGGRFLLGLSNANRHAAGVEVGDEVEVELEFDPEPQVVAESADFGRAIKRRSNRPDRVSPPAGRSQTGARARYREREEARDAHTADREDAGHAAELGVGRGRRDGPRKNLSGPTKGNNQWKRRHKANERDANAVRVGRRGGGDPTADGSVLRPRRA
jgi:hypothetical protein